jgi:hypothetical protein
MAKPKSKKRKKNLNIWTNLHLRAAFREINKNYFDNLLQEPRTLIFEKMDEDGRTQWMMSGLVIMKIHNDFRHHPDVARLVLTHEMTHLGLGIQYKGDRDGSHGMRFQAEKVRLFNEGAYDTVL